MEIKIYINTKFNVGDTVYYLAGLFGEPIKLRKSKIININYFGMVKDAHAKYVYLMENCDNVEERHMFKTEYEAKIALANMI